MDTSDKVGLSIGAIIVIALAAAVIGKMVPWYLLVIMLMAVIAFGTMRYYAALKKDGVNAVVSAADALKDDLMKAIRGGEKS